MPAAATAIGYATVCVPDTAHPGTPRCCYTLTMPLHMHKGSLSAMHSQGYIGPGCWDGYSYTQLYMLQLGQLHIVTHIMSNNAVIYY